MSQSNRRLPAHQLILFLALVALTAWAAQAREWPGQAPVAPAATSRARIEVAFVLDTTGSMSGLIEGAKQKIWMLANQLASGQPKPEIRIGLVGYRDRGDTYVTRRFQLSDDIDAVYAALFSFRADGGGDTPESVNQALHEAVTQLGWSRDPGVYRVIFLVGDAPPHMNYPDDVAFPATVKLARDRGIVVNAIQCGSLPETTTIWGQIAQLGHGEYASIAQDGAIVMTTTPMDDELASLNRELADTVIVWGGEEEQEVLRQKVLRSLAAPASVAASRLGYLAKLGGRVNSGAHDLVDALREGLVVLEDLPAARLPAELQAMDEAERGAFVAAKRVKREELEGKISGLTRERDAYVRTEQSRLAAEGAGDSFDLEVLEAIRKQAAEKGIVYE